MVGQRGWLAVEDNVSPVSGVNGLTADTANPAAASLPDPVPTGVEANAFTVVIPFTIDGAGDDGSTFEVRFGDPAQVAGYLSLLATNRFANSVSIFCGYASGDGDTNAVGFTTIDVDTPHVLTITVTDQSVTMDMDGNENIVTNWDGSTPPIGDGSRIRLAAMNALSAWRVGAFVFS